MERKLRYGIIFEEIKMALMFHTKADGQRAQRLLKGWKGVEFAFTKDDLIKFANKYEFKYSYLVDPIN